MVDVIDPTTFKSAADKILTLLEDAASDTGWSPSRSCVTIGPPAAECDGLFVWGDGIDPIKDQAGPRCQTVLRARFQYALSLCVGTVTCDPTGAALAHDVPWGVQAGFVQSVLQGSLCPVGDVCATVRWGTFTLLTIDGGFSWWQGSVQIDLSPEELFS